MATSVAQRLALCAAGTVVGLALVEGALRLAGALVRAERDRPMRLAREDEGAFRILCLGESTTALGGAQSYPSHLERELARARPDLRFTVINRGAPARNTDFILEHLEENLALHRPDVVVTMMGVNDTGETVPFAARSERVAVRILEDLRTVKVARLAWRHARAGIGLPVHDDVPPAFGPGIAPLPPPTDAAVARRLARAQARLEAGDQDAAGRIVERARRVAPRDVAVIGKLVMVRTAQGRLDELRAELEAATAAGVDDARVRTTLHGIYFGLSDRRATAARWEEAEDLLRRAIALDPTAAPPAHDRLARIRRARGDEAGARAHERTARTLRTSEYNPATRRNYLELVRILERHGIPLVAVQYPLRSVSSLRRMLADAANVRFVSAERAFERAVAAGSWEDYFTDAFAGDFGHATGRGNALLAQAVAPTVLDALGVPQASARAPDVGTEGQGLEPRSPGPEPGILPIGRPLNDSRRPARFPEALAKVKRGRVRTPDR